MPKLRNREIKYKKRLKDNVTNLKKNSIKLFKSGVVVDINIHRSAGHSHTELVKSMLMRSMLMKQNLHFT